MIKSVCKWMAGSMLLLLGWPAMAAMPQPDVPVNSSGLHLVVNLPQARLFLYQDGQLAKIYPVAVGKMLTQTPIGSYDITGVYHAPSWHVPKSIQEEMKKQGKPVLTVVPPGPENPLGPVFIRFGAAKLGLGFHGTNVPSSVPGFRSHGCIRLKNDDALDLAGTVSPGAAVTVAYQTVLLNEDRAGELWLTAYRNHYKQDDPSFRSLADVLLNWQKEKGVAVVGKRVDAALRERSGKPVCLTCKTTGKAKVSGELVAVHWLTNGNGEPANVQPPADKLDAPAGVQAGNHENMRSAVKRKAGKPALAL